MLGRLWSRLHPGGLRARIGAIIFIHALLVYATLALFTARGPVPTSRVYLLPSPDRVAAIVLAFEHTPVGAYPDLIRAFSDDRQEVSVVALPPRPRAVESSDRSAATRMAEPYRTALDGRAFWIEVNGRDVLSALDRQPGYASTPFTVVAGLSNGRAAEIVRYTTAPVARFINRRQRLNIAIVAVDLLVIFWLAAQSTKPVEQLLRAVRSDNMRLIGRTGAREFQELGAAFRELRERLQSALEERTRIIAAVAHDFRTYLTRLELRTDFITNSDQRMRAMRDLSEMRQLMNDVFTFACPDLGEGDAVAVVDVGEELRLIVEARQEAGEDVVLTPVNATLLTLCTPLAFRRMVANLLDNALRYGEAPVNIAVFGLGAETLVCIEDHGPGVPHDRLSGLTEPFVRLETSRARHTGGVGLGLSIVQGLAHRFGGLLQLENRQEGGLRACLRLRRIDDTV